MSVELSIAIPTFNGAERLPPLLEKLKSQVNTEYFRWEVIVVDNNSTDATAQVVQNYQKDWTEAYSLKYYFEPEQGVAFARIKAVQVAQGEWIGFLDDDNWPDENWVAAAYTFAQKHPRAGAFGGQIHGAFETNPPPNFKRIQSFLAIRELGDQPRLYEPDTLSLPPSAALMIRKQAWIESVPDRPLFKGRVGGSFIGGEDYEVLLYLHYQGWEIWYAPYLHTYHQIPAVRLERNYLLALAKGSGLSICQLRMINIPAWQKPIVMIKVFLGSLRRAIVHLFRYRGQVRTDLVAACELTFFLSTLMSPVYVLRNSILVRRSE